jgi:tetratricopeptide (TPR) repeat protein
MVERGKGEGRLDRGSECLNIYRLAAADNPEKAKAALTEAQNLLEKVDPTDADSLEKFTQCCMNLSEIKRTSPSPDATIFFLRKARDALTKLKNIDPLNPKYHSGLSDTFVLQGRAYEQHGRFEDALMAYQGAIEPRQAAFKHSLLGTEQWKYQQKALSECLVALAKAQRDQHRPAEAVATTLKRKELWPRDTVELCRVARHIALCIPLVGQGEAKLNADQQAERDLYACQAVTVLAEAIDCGYQDVRQLEKAPELKPLQAREDFQKLLAQLKERRNRGAK